MPRPKTQTNPTEGLLLPEGAILLGIDPGTACTGWGVIQLTKRGAAYIDSGVVRTKPEFPLDQRLLTISTGIREVITKFSPVAVALEEPFFGENANSALILGQTRGAILLTVAQADRMIFSYSAREVKRAAVGNGNATKEQVAFMMIRVLGASTEVVNRLQKLPADATDALAIAFCHTLRCKIDYSLTEK